MDSNDGLSAPEPSDALQLDTDLPPGDHPLEVAARNGIGPLSALGREQWHGHARPCVSCGQLVKRDQPSCDHCNQDLSTEMLARMHAHAGPWFVLEHVRPFPGVKLERIVRQVKRGVITETSILRGPDSDFQWRFAAEIPGLCRFFGRCWKCHRSASLDDSHCPSCRAPLLFRDSHAATTRSRPESVPAQPAASPAKAQPAPGSAPKVNRISDSDVRNVELEVLRSVIEGNPLTSRPAGASMPQDSTIVRALWLPVTLLVVFVLGLAWISNCRSNAASHPTPPQSRPLEQVDAQRSP